MVFRHAFLVLIIILMLVACQSEDNNSKLQPSATMQHLQRDKGSNYKQPVGAITATILPHPLTSADQATAVMGNCQEKGSFQWEVNGNELYGEISGILNNSFFQRGDSLRLVSHCGSQIQDVATVVENAPPTISAVKFQSPQLVSGQDLIVIPDAKDVDGDLIEYRYEWSIDGLLIGSVSGNRLPGHLLKKGTQVTLAVTPSDSFNDGATFQGVSFFIPNAAPSINSQPPPLSTNYYVYNVEATDPDSDELTYQLGQGPADMSIDNKTGILTWSVDKNTSVGGYDIEIIVEDSEGLQAKQFYTLSLSTLESAN